MQIRYHNIHENRSYVVSVISNELRIGRHAGCDIVVQSPYLSDEAARLYRHESGWRLEVRNTQGMRLGAAVIDCGRTVVLPADGTFQLFPWQFTLDPEDSEEISADETVRRLEHRALLFLQSVHRRLLEQMDSVEEQSDEITQDELLRLERNLDAISEEQGLSGELNQDLVRYLAGMCLRGELTDDALRESREVGVSAQLTSGHSDWSELQSAIGSFEVELRRLQRRISVSLGLPGCQNVSQRMHQIDRGFREAWHAVCGEILEDQLLYLCRRQLKKQIKDIVFGYGPLEDLLRLPAITEIMVVGCDRIFVERDGVIENSGRRFLSDRVTERIIDRIVSQVGRRIDQSQPIVDARLQDGSRVNAVIAPVALDGPLLTIRKFAAVPLTTASLIRSGSLTEAAAAFLQACVRNGRNIVVSGGTGSGKTTLLNCLSNFIPPTERIVTIEDTAELRLQSPHVARMETRPANVEGEGQLTICDLVRNALRMRPDRIVVGECRGAEALWMLQAMNTGHDGSLTTIHANSAAEVPQRLEVMVQSAAALPGDSVFRQIAGAIDIIVHVAQMRDGTRVVKQIAELLPRPDGHVGVVIRDLFLRKEGGELCPTGCMPTFLADLLQQDDFDVNQMYPTSQFQCEHSARIASVAGGSGQSIRREIVT